MKRFVSKAVAVVLAVVFVMSLPFRTLMLQVHATLSVVSQAEVRMHLLQPAALLT